MSIDTLEARAVEMSRDLAEKALAKRIALDVLQSIKEIPEGRRHEAANWMLHKRLLAEMLDYKDRLTKHVEGILTEGARRVGAKGGSDE
jgi:hypothetical protein